MNYVEKREDSEITAQNLSYIVNGDNTAIRDILLSEQNKLCVYTETYLGRTDQKDIDHFNPTLKGTEGDGYENWFLCKALWNREKGKKWANFQPVLHPTDPTIEQRIFYYEGNYVLTDENDLPAKNLIELLKLSDPDLAEDRRKYIRRLKLDAERYNETIEEHVRNLLISNPERVYFIRAIQEEFGISVF